MHIPLKLIAVALAAIAIALGLAWYMIEKGTVLTTARIGPWTIWRSEGDPKADPYTKAHVARSGRLPITSASARYYLASNDSDGDTLRSRCEYSIEGRAFPVAWWSIAVYDGRGRLIANKAERYAFNNRDIVLRGDGTFRIALADEARAGNWLPIADVGRLQLVLRLYASRAGSAGAPGLSLVGDQLPEINKVACQ